MKMMKQIKRNEENLLEKSYSLTSISVLTKSVSFSLTLNFDGPSFRFKASCGGTTFTLSSWSF